MHIVLMTIFCTVKPTRSKLMGKMIDGTVYKKSMLFHVTKNMKINAKIWVKFGSQVIELFFYFDHF